jgi:hypothetical protein
MCVCIAVTMMIGLNLPKAHVPWWASWVVVVFMLFHLIIELLLEIHGCINGHKQKGTFFTLFCYSIYITEIS